MSDTKYKIQEYMANNFPESWRHKTLKDIQGDSYKNVIESITNWDWKVNPSFAIVSKQNGIGKTHLAICCLRKYLFDRFEENENFEVSHFKNYFYKERTIFYELMESYKDKKNEFKTEKEIINFYCGLPILILDDLFSNRINEFARRIVLDIIDERIDWKGLPTVITSNLDMNGISEIDNRIASRLSSGIVFDFTTQIKDFRIK